MTSYLDDRWAHHLRHLLWDVSSRTVLLGEAALAGTPLTLPAVGLLDAIGSQPGVTIAEISRRLPTSQQAVSQLAARLERLGLIERHVAGGRSSALHLTEAGRAARVQGRTIELALEARLEEALGTERYDRLRELLEEAREAVLGLEPDAYRVGRDRAT